MKDNTIFKYGLGVKVTYWHDRVLSYPHDNSNPKTSLTSHYRTLGDPEQYFIPKTATQEQQETAKIRHIKRVIALPQISFSSYPLDDFRFDHFGLNQIPKEEFETTYTNDYKPPRPIVTKINCCDSVLHPLMNRIPKNDFELLPTSTNKFMDDHLIQASKGRKTINFLRQLRWDNLSFEFEVLLLFDFFLEIIQGFST